MYPAAKTTLGSATAERSRKSSSRVARVGRRVSSRAATNPPTTVTEAAIAPYSSERSTGPSRSELWRTAA